LGVQFRVKELDFNVNILSTLGVYILSQIFIITPKCDKRVMKIFIIAPNLNIALNEKY